MALLKDSERRDFLEICDDRRSMILTSQTPVRWKHTLSPVRLTCKVPGKVQQGQQGQL
jgi:hypothetical protein